MVTSSIFYENKMSELKKIDYRKLDEKAPMEVPPTASEGGEKPSFFGSLANKWGLMNKKEKIEMFVLVVTLVSIVAVIIYYFSNTSPKYNPEESHAPGAEQSIDELSTD